jgi:hypothetical protein
VSRGYNSAGKRLSSMTHAARGHDCNLCGERVFGNGGQVSHGRGHVRRGEAIELVKYFGFIQSPSRLFLAPDDVRVDEFLARGFEQV